MTWAYFDCFSGAAGDMIVGACLAAGAPEESLRAALAKLALPEVSLRIERVVKKGISSVAFVPEIAEHHHHGGHGHHHHGPEHRNLGAIREIIDRAGLSARVTRQAITIFTRLAEAEARVHGTTTDQIHFHEVGAADAIMDIVGACAALELLGVERVTCAPLVVGSGTVTCAHGVMPVPAPATAELIRGLPVQSRDVGTELLTPTGAAILTTLAESFGAMPPMRVTAVGYGAGARDHAGLPNVLRVMVGEPTAAPAEQAEGVWLLEANIDDATGEILGHALEQLLAAGALEAFYVPVLMKKSRPGALLRVLCRAEERVKLETVIFTETTTFGIRRQWCERTVLGRTHRKVATRYGEVRIKCGRWADQVVTASPEYEDCRAAAAAHGATVKDVMAAAMAAYQSEV